MPPDNARQYGDRLVYVLDISSIAVLVIHFYAFLADERNPFVVAIVVPEKLETIDIGSI
jgi:hypothetical protein